jgi:hypothetical protein
MNHNSNRKDAGKPVLALFVVFLAIVLRDATLGTLSLTWTAIMGGIVISLSLSSILFPGKRADKDVNVSEGQT